MPLAALEQLIFDARMEIGNVKQVLHDKNSANASLQVRLRDSEAENALLRAEVAELRAENAALRAGGGTRRPKHRNPLLRLCESSDDEAGPKKRKRLADLPPGRTIAFSPSPPPHEPASSIDTPPQPTGGTGAPPKRGRGNVEWRVVDH
jgi:hypothetical protein